MLSRSFQFLKEIVFFSEDRQLGFLTIDDVFACFNQAGEGRNAAPLFVQMTGRLPLFDAIQAQEMSLSSFSQLTFPPLVIFLGSCEAEVVRKVVEHCVDCSSHFVFIPLDIDRDLFARHPYLFQSFSRLPSYPPSWSSWPTELLPDFLFISGDLTAYDANLLQSMRIEVVVNCTLDLRDLGPSIAVHQVAVADRPTEPISAHFDRTGTILNDAMTARKRVLVHCQQGSSRSVCVAAAFLILHFGLTFTEAYFVIRAKRSLASINNGFSRQLQSLTPRRRIHPAQVDDHDLETKLREQLSSLIETQWFDDLYGGGCEILMASIAKRLNWNE